MRPRVALGLVTVAMVCLVIAILPFQTETRLVGVARVIVYAVMFVADVRRGPGTGRHRW